MKKIVNLISILLILSMLVLSMSACFGDNDNNPPEENHGDQVDNNNGNNNNDNTGDNGNTDNEDKDYITYFTGKQSVLLIGQSNMAGRGFAEDVEPISDDRITMLNDANEWVKM